VVNALSSKLQPRSGATAAGHYIEFAYGTRSPCYVVGDAKGKRGTEVTPSRPRKPSPMSNMISLPPSNASRELAFLNLASISLSGLRRAVEARK
jgi:hypothetical protein